MSSGSHARAVAYPISLLLATALFVGCDETAPSGASEAAGPQRVVVLAPAVAEMLESLELLDRVVGVGDFGPWPAGLTERPAVGGYSAPNVERVLELGCDLLLTATSEAATDSHRQLETLGVRVVALDTSTFEGVFSALESLGAIFDRERRAAALADELRERLDALAARASGLPPRKVLFVVGRDPVYVAGPGSHIDRMIDLVGGTNVAHDALAPYAQLSLETVLERLPDVIVDTSDNRPEAPRGRSVGNWARWSFLPAVRRNRVYQVEPGRLVIPGVRLPEMTELMGRMIHPEVFGEPQAAELGGAR